MIPQNTHLPHFSIKNILKWGFWGIVPCAPCIFVDFSLLYIFCTKMGYLGVLGYIYTYGRKIKKNITAKTEKIYLYNIYTKCTAKLAFTAK